MRRSQYFLHQLTQVESPNITFIDQQFPIVMKKGNGMRVYDVDDKRYLDFTACFGVLALGHRPQVVLKAIRQQSAKMIHGMGDVHPNDVKIRFLMQLKQLLPYEHPNTLLTTSGGEAVDAALKTAILATSKNQFISFQDAYHGLITGPLSLTDRELFTSGFGQWIKNPATILPFPSQQVDQQSEVLTRLEDELKKKCYAAVILEPIQGRGGDRAFPLDFLRSCQRLCHQYQTKLIFDEIFTGFGRTGTLFAFEQSGVIPDIICLGKALGGGLPLSACAGDILEVWGKSQGEARHTSTYLGHPLACATGLASVKEIVRLLPTFSQELQNIDNEFLNFQKLAETSGAYTKHPFILNGKGFMRGLWFHQSPANFAATLMKELLKSGFIVLPSGATNNTLSLTPPLIATAVDYKKLLAQLLQILAAI